MSDGDPMLPPWLRHPDRPRFTSFWYTGPSEAEAEAFEAWLEARSVAERVAYFRRHGPVPPLWADWVASTIYSDWDHASDDETAALVARLQREHGLVDVDAWERALASEDD